VRKATMFMLLAVGCFVFATKGQAQAQCPHTTCERILCYDNKMLFEGVAGPGNTAAMGDFPCSSWCWIFFCTSSVGTLSYIDPITGEVGVVGTLRKEDREAFWTLIPKGATLAQAKRFASTITIRNHRALLTDAEVAEAKEDSKPCSGGG